MTEKHYVLLLLFISFKHTIRCCKHLLDVEFMSVLQSKFKSWYCTKNNYKFLFFILLFYLQKYRAKYTINILNKISRESNLMKNLNRSSNFWSLLNIYNVIKVRRYVYFLPEIMHFRVFITNAHTEIKTNSYAATIYIWHKYICWFDYFLT